MSRIGRCWWEEEGGRRKVTWGFQGFCLSYLAAIFRPLLHSRVESLFSRIWRCLPCCSSCTLVMSLSSVISASHPDPHSDLPIQLVPAKAAAP